LSKEKYKGSALENCWFVSAQETMLQTSSLPVQSTKILENTGVLDHFFENGFIKIYLSFC